MTIVAGGGHQADTDQDNYGAGIDWEFLQFNRSDRQILSLGASYTFIGTDAPTGRRVHALGLYPQLTLLASERQRWQPFFFVRALGPTWISGRRLGERQQAEHFVFQAQVGAGLVAPDDRWFMTMSYRHFSNARLFSPNDGFDLPVMVGFGRKF